MDYKIEILNCRRMAGAFLPVRGTRQMLRSSRLMTSVIAPRSKPEWTDERPQRQTDGVTGF